MAKDNKIDAAVGASADNSDAPKQAFEVQRIYIKDSSFEAPDTPGVFRKEWKPEVKLDVSTKSNTVEDNIHEVLLTVTATAKMDDANVFLVEVQQAGIFTLKEFDKDQMGHMLGSYCPNLLFPFAREAVSDLVVRGGFPPLYLAPINFDALYQQHLKNQQDKAGDTTQH